MRPTRSGPQHGAALLAAMLTVTLVAAFAATALSQQAGAVEVESAARTRMQASWALTGAFDWARQLLVEDGRIAGPDHPAEAWAKPVRGIPLSGFMAAARVGVAPTEADASTRDPDALLSREVVDAQSRLNVANLTDGDQVSPPDVLAFSRLFASLELPQAELSRLVEKLRQAGTPATGAAAATANTPLVPQRMEQLVWLGLSAATVERLRPYVVVLPVRTPVNLNTAGTLVVQASIAGMEMAAAQRFVQTRTRSPLRTLEEASRLAGKGPTELVEHQHSINSRFFEVNTTLQQGHALLREQAMVQRDGANVKTLWRERPVQPVPPLASRNPPVPAS